MIYRALSEDGDMTIGNKNAFLSGSEAVQQAVVTRLRQLIYEWWEKLEDGVPYWQKIIAQRDVSEAVRLIRARIEQTTDVISVLAFEHHWNNDTRTLTIRAGVQSIYGEFVIEEALA